MFSRPSATAKGIDPATTAKAASVVTKMARRLNRSASHPARSPAASPLADQAAARAAICSADALRVTTAVSGRATAVIWLPKADTDCAVQRRTNPAFRQRADDPIGGRCPRGVAEFDPNGTARR